jgi:microcompartment protein CcmL/EutN
LKLALGLLETMGFTPGMVALDVMEKTASIRVYQSELNDLLGVCLKIEGKTADVIVAIEAGRVVADRMGGKPIVDVIPHPHAAAWPAIQSEIEFNALIQQNVVFAPTVEKTLQNERHEEKNEMKEKPLALGFIETQGYTAVFEAIDSACKAANVEVIGKEKLGGGYISVVIQGDVEAVKEAIKVGRSKVDGLGKLIAAHVIPHPSSSVLRLLPQV